MAGSPTFLRSSRAWFEWRKAILDELELLGSISRSLSMINDDPRPTYDWTFYVWYNGVDPTKYKDELCQRNPLCYPDANPIPQIQW